MGNRVLKDHNLFKPDNLEQGRHEVVGDCNGFTMQQRWEAETPAFAEAILRFARREGEILDYGCGVGRLAKEILKQNKSVYITGTDASKKMLIQAEVYVDNGRFGAVLPHNLTQKFDIIYLVYVLQHVPAIEIREVLSRIHTHLKDDGVFIYCSSDYRMAIRYDGQGFFDDRFLGVDLQAEVLRLFDLEKPLFDEKTLEGNPILKKMITGCDGGLAHPAFVYRKKKISGSLFNAQVQETISFDDPPGPILKEGGTHAVSVVKEKKQKEKEKEKIKDIVRQEAPIKLLLLNRLAPGDILVMTNAIRDLHLAYPGQFIVDVRTPCSEIFNNSPHIKKLQYNEDEYNKINNRFCSQTHAEVDAIIAQILSGDRKSLDKLTAWMGDIFVLDMHYPLIHRSHSTGKHFAEGHREWLEYVLGLVIPQTDIRPQIFLSQDEQAWPGPALVKAGLEGPYWVINAGSKDDMSLKQYPFYQEVVDLLKDKITFIQIGQKSHNHRPLEGVVDMVDQTNLRELFRLIQKAEGVISCVSLPMHVAAAFSKPCVVVAGAREGIRWEMYPNQQYLAVNGCLNCAPYDGCWRGKPSECNNKVKNIPRCMFLIRPEDVSWAVTRYYEGGMLEYAEIFREVAHA